VELWLAETTGLWTTGWVCGFLKFGLSGDVFVYLPLERLFAVDETLDEDLISQG
jgi:hypothetical protein